MRDTPCLVVDADVLEANLSAMAEHARARGLALRPHAKTHKSLDIARHQLAHGAVGLTVATVAEAEVFAAGGFDDLFIAYPIWAEGPRAERLRALTTLARVRVGADSVESVRMLAAAVHAGRRAAGSASDRADSTPLAIAVEVDSGHHRSGCAPDRAAEVAAAARDARLAVDGVFTFPGHSYGLGAGDDAARDEAAALTIARDALTAAGIPCPIVSGGSTPSAHAADQGVLTELRPGVYALGDAQQWELGSCDPASIALWALATVVSRREGIVVLDAGSKMLGADRPGWTTGFGRVLDAPEARIVALSEHHATISLPVGMDAPAVGTRMRVAPNHVCSAVNLADALVIERAGVETGTWSVSARGANT
ncbi:D-TA family PLP-dependent enzyme [Microcella alkalica]|uniref:D-serine deaminase-like pyridoxal phosphate-dependent protein n=1 Tax=Microcella alkalica TaxID=355930 RepID=A0A839E7N0_9MICO|nr:alanine racemase [Microcella alkalica]MBA8847173.1 D-serine deaminase-like pyridoxal phosphate-dependent protein [Microcella alkalica]